MRESGIYSFEELVSDVDGSEAFRWGADSVRTSMAESWDASQESGPEMAWSVEDDDDDLELSITPRALAVLVTRGRTHCEGCAGTCGR